MADKPTPRQIDGLKAYLPKWLLQVLCRKGGHGEQVQIYRALHACKRCGAEILHNQE